VVPITFANVTAGASNEQALRVRVYWSVRFAAFDVVSFYSKATAALVAANGGVSFSVFTNTNNFHGRLFTPGGVHVQPGTGVVSQAEAAGGMDWFEAARYPSRAVQSSMCGGQFDFVRLAGRAPRVRPWGARVW